MSWKPGRGWLVRAKSLSGAESKQKYTTYAEAVAEATVRGTTGNYREVWVEEVGVVPRAWHDRYPRKQERGDGARRHVLDGASND